MGDSPRKTAAIRKLLGKADRPSAPCSAIPPMPEVFPRRPYDDDEPDGYLESDRDYFDNNGDACNWFLENADAIRAALNDNNPATGSK